MEDQFGDFVECLTCFGRYHVSKNSIPYQHVCPDFYDEFGNVESRRDQKRDERPVEPVKERGKIRSKGNGVEKLRSGR